MPSHTLIRVHRTFNKTGQQNGHYPCSNASGWRYVKGGLLPPPISTGPNSRAFIREELDAVLSARVGGADDAAIKRLVADLVARRADNKGGI